LEGKSLASIRVFGLGCFSESVDSLYQLVGWDTCCAIHRINTFNINTGSVRSLEGTFLCALNHLPRTKDYESRKKILEESRDPRVFGKENLKMKIN
jgi:hypothetical protein